MFSKIKNMKEIQSEKGLYYPYIMQELGCPVINGELIYDTHLKYFYSKYVVGLFDGLISIYYPHKSEDGSINYNDTSDKVFEKISKSEFKQSVIYALSDLFCDGCDPEDINEEEMFGFFEKEKYKDILID